MRIKLIHLFSGNRRREWQYISNISSLLVAMRQSVPPLGSDWICAAEWSWTWSSSWCSAFDRLCNIVTEVQNDYIVVYSLYWRLFCIWISRLRLTLLIFYCLIFDTLSLLKHLITGGNQRLWYYRKKYNNNSCGNTWVYMSWEFWLQKQRFFYVVVVLSQSLLFTWQGRGGAPETTKTFENGAQAEQRAWERGDFIAWFVRTC